VKERLFQWIEALAASPHPGAWLFLLAFAEASFFPVPPDVLLITLGVVAPEKAIGYALITTAGSVLGGALGYAIGLYGGRPVLLRFFDRTKVAAVERLYDRYNAWATGIAGLTPIPYKVFTIGGGAFRIRFRVFMLASLASRGLRFMTEGILLYFFGAAARRFLYEQFNWLSIALVIVGILGFWAVHRVGKHAHAREIERQGAVEGDGPGA